MAAPPEFDPAGDTAIIAAVAVDAFVVRMTVVPAVLALVGDRAWWLPARLARILPDLDVEGRDLPGEPVPDAARAQHSGSVVQAGEGSAR